MQTRLGDHYLANIRQIFTNYKSLADKAIQQVNPEFINIVPGPEDNSIALIVKHMAGNMLSRWTDFLNSDGEKTWRNRDTEFEGGYANKEDMLAAWEKGWNCVFDALDPLVAEDLERLIYIRGEQHTVLEALNRQLAHYSYHVGQIVFLARHLRGEGWQSLSIPKGQSDVFNEKKKTTHNKP